MPITVTCECGRVFHTREEYAGRRGLCPDCKRQFDIPIPFERVPVTSIVAPQYSEPDLPPIVLPPFVYKMVQVPPNIEIAESDRIGQKAAVYLENSVNKQASDGWEFYRVDTIGVQITPGCLSALFGATAQTIQFNVVTFRRPPNDADGERAADLLAAKQAAEQRAADLLTPKQVAEKRAADLLAAKQVAEQRAKNAQEASRLEAVRAEAKAKRRIDRQ
jgi:hypothetical protein